MLLAMALCAADEERKRDGRKEGITSTTRP
jgi:hypothetical protein